MIQFEQQQKENGQNKQVVLHADGDFLSFWGSEAPSYHIAHSSGYPPRIVAGSKNSYWLREETERLLKVKPWITPVVVFTKAFIKFGPPVKGVRVVNKKYLLQTLQSVQGDTSNAVTIWRNREQLAHHLTGYETAPVQPIVRPAIFCPKCGKKMIEKIAKGGPAVAGKPFWVCPDYPQCKTAMAIEQN